MGTTTCVRGQNTFPVGESKILRQGDRDGVLQDFSIVRLAEGERVASVAALERAWLLLHGRVIFRWEEGSAETARGSLLDEGPSVLHAPRGARIELEAASESELSFHATVNERGFPVRCLSGDSCRAELRGAGTMGETATRIVRTLIDNTSAPFSNLVLGEVVTMPGRWSSYPPHHHPQPEIYHYRFFPARGFGFAQVGEMAFVVRSGDTTIIREGEVHPQAAAPGYAMWYLWCIRHLDGNRYLSPIFDKEHGWTTREDAEIWRLK
jgi:5-deoxy-glucuronate isomerase